MSEAAKEFRLYENNPDQGSWVLYGTRYSAEQLWLKQAQLIAILDERVIFHDIGDAIAVEQKWGEERDQSTLLLLEELASVNEALDLHANQGDIAGVWLTKVLEHNPIMEISRETVSGWNLPDLYDAIEIGWGQVLRDIGIAERQNRVLTSRQRRLFAQMKQNKDRAVELLQGRHILLDFSS
jgi:hypothetical protein